MQKDILYKPNLGYKENYYTEGTFNKKKNQEENIENSNVSKIDKIHELENQIDALLPLIPDAIKEAYLTPYIALKDEFSNMDIPEPIPKDDNIPEIKPSTAQEDSEKKVPGFFDKGPDIYINIEDPYKKKNKIQKNIYANNFMDIYKDYLTKLNTSTQSYTYSILSAMQMTDKNNNISNYVTSKINNTNLYHIGDSIIRGSIVLSQKVNLHKKLFDMDETIMNLRNIKIASAYIERYFGEMKQNESSDLAVLSNSILDNSKKLANKKYQENFLALYKYLNSDVILYNESLKSLTQQARSLSIVDKFDERGK